MKHMVYNWFAAAVCDAAFVWRNLLFQVRGVSQDRTELCHVGTRAMQILTCVMMMSKCPLGCCGTSALLQLFRTDRSTWPHRGGTGPWAC